MSEDRNLFVVGSDSVRFVFRILAKTPNGKDGVGTVHYFHIGDDGVYKEGEHGFCLSGIIVTSGTRLSLKGLRGTWEELVNNGWLRLVAEEPYWDEHCPPSR